MEAYCKRYAAYRGTGVTTIDNANGSVPSPALTPTCSFTRVSKFGVPMTVPSLVTLLTTHTVPACFAARTVMSTRH
jgi:hypothetical protein